MTHPYAIETGGRITLAESRLSATVLQEIDGKQTLLVFVPKGAAVQLMPTDNNSDLLAVAPNGALLFGSSVSVRPTTEMRGSKASAGEKKETT